MKSEPMAAEKTTSKPSMYALVSRGATFGAGLLLKHSINEPFDLILYPAVLLWLGNIWGGLVMTALSVVLNVIIIRAYDWSKTDWLLIETLKGVRDEAVSVGKRKRLIRRLLQKSDTLAFFILCLDDPITATLYLRKGSHQYNGMSARDWKIFFAATIVANLYWIIGIASVIEVVKWLLR